MSRILSSLLGPPRVQANATFPDDDRYFEGSIRQFFAVMSGGQITADSALQIRSVWAAVRYVADTLASLPLHLMRDSDPSDAEEELPGEMQGTVKQIASDHPAYRVLSRQPNHWQTPFQFWQQTVVHLMMRSKAYAQIKESTVPGLAFELWPIHPDRLEKIERVDNGRLRYTFRQGKGSDQNTGGDLGGTQTLALMQDELVRFENMTLDGITAISAIDVGKEGLGLAQALERYGSLFFRNGASPSMLLSHPGKLSEPARKNLENSIMRRSAAGAAHRALVVEEGMKAEKVSSPNNEAQFIEARQHQIEEDARLFRVPPHKIADLKRSSFSNIEQQAMEAVSDTLRPIAVLIEQAIARDLLADDGDVYARFDFDALLRGEMANRYQAYSTAITSGWMVRNEARIAEGKNPLPGLWEPLEPTNMANAGRQGLTTPSGQSDPQPQPADPQEDG